MNYVDLIELLENFNIDKIFIEKYIENKINPFMNIRGIVPLYLNNKRKYILIDDINVLKNDKSKEEEIERAIDKNLVKKYNIYKYNEIIIELINRRELTREKIEENIKNDNDKKVLMELLESKIESL
ncbi:MAG: hypothetical protein ACRC30_10385 [Clostridium sp.]